MVAEYLAELALETGKNRLKDKVDEQRLKIALSNYIERNRKYNEICTFAEEIDFQGLVKFIEQDLISCVSNRLFEPS